MKFFSRKPAPRPLSLEKPTPGTPDYKMLAMQLRGRAKPEIFAPAEPFPGVVPKTVPRSKVMAFDHNIKAATSQAALAYDDAPTWQGQQPYWPTFGGARFLGYPILAEMAQRPEYRRISEILAYEMTRKFIRLTISGKAEKSDKLDALQAEFERLKVQENFALAALFDGLMGRSHLYLDTGATDKPAELETPLLPDAGKIGKGDLLAIRLVEPLWTYPAAYNASNPLAPDFYKPSKWFVFGKTVSASRLLRFVGREVPDIIRPAYAFGGLSMTQMAQPYVENWIATRTNIGNLVRNFSVMTFQTELEALSSPNNPQFFERLELFALCRDNNSLFVHNNTEKLTNVAAPIAGLDALQAQAQEHQASVAGIPFVKLFGETPMGLNASSDGEIRSFYDWIKAFQKQLFGGHLDFLLKVIQLSLWGRIDPEIGYEFVSLWELDTAAEAAVWKTLVDGKIEMVNVGAISPEEMRQSEAMNDKSPFAGIDLAKPLPEPEFDPANEEDPQGAKILPDPARTAEPRKELRSGV